MSFWAAAGFCLLSAAAWLMVNPDVQLRTSPAIAAGFKTLDQKKLHTRRTPE
jgi:hypothetical protein